MSTSKKIILGIFTVLPLVFGFLYFILFFSFFINITSGNIHPDLNEEQIPQFLQSFAPMFVMLFIAIIIGFVLLIYYLVHISNNHRLDSSQRLLWVLIIVFTSTIGQVAYFILEVWPDKPVQE